MRILLLLLVSVSLYGQEPARPFGSKWYWASVAAMAGGSAFDAGTSVRLNRFASANGLHESNPLLANSQGQFVPARGIAVKVVVLAATVGCERAVLYLFSKQGVDTRRAERAFSWVNVGFGAGYTGIGAHNMTLH